MWMNLEYVLWTKKSVRNNLILYDDIYMKMSRVGKPVEMEYICGLSGAKDGKGEETGAGTLRDRKYADFLLG